MLWRTVCQERAAEVPAEALLRGDQAGEVRRMK